MLIINDFFKRKKEAVSNQMEMLHTAIGGKIIAATRFMNQKSFQKEDRRDQIFIYPPFLYQIIMTFEVLLTKEKIHIFEEEPNRYKEWLFNLSKKDIYVSLYRAPFPEYAEHLKKYKNLKRVFVELDAHKDSLINYGIDEKVICISPTPAKINRKSNKKKINTNNINLLFASWNNAEGNPLQERGLVYLIDLLVLNPNFTLTVLLRDNKTNKFIEMIKAKGIEKRVSLIDIREEQLESMFDNSDFVVYAIQKTLTKDVPNSLIDGLSRGKPLMISTVFGLSKVVENAKAGFLIIPNTKPKKMNITEETYRTMSENAYKLSEKYTCKNYISSIIKEYEKKD